MPTRCATNPSSRMDMTLLKLESSDLLDQGNVAGSDVDLWLVSDFEVGQLSFLNQHVSTWLVCLTVDNL
jgi:hypothetical protein